MRILIYGDNHFSTYSSILRTRGEVYSTRLENQIQSINWVEDLSYIEKVDAVVCLGDFFSNPELSSEEISALSLIAWNKNTQHMFLVGNHEMEKSFSSSFLFNMLNEFCSVVSIPCSTDVDDVQICYLPYVTDKNRKSLLETFGKADGKRVILSHNDIKGINYGNVVSTVGYDIEDIKESCDLFINGHIHNGGVIGNVINVGNLTGQNLNEDCFKYKHCAIILDTETLSIKYFENPHALNFAKVDESDIQKLKFPKNSIISVRCKESTKKNVDNFSDENVIFKRAVVEYDPVEVVREEKKIDIDHIAMFHDCCLSTIGESSILKEELSYVCK